MARHPHRTAYLRGRLVPTRGARPVGPGGRPHAVDERLTLLGGQGRAAPQARRRHHRRRARAPRLRQPGRRPGRARVRRRPLRMGRRGRCSDRRRAVPGGRLGRRIRRGARTGMAPRAPRRRPEGTDAFGRRGGLPGARARRARLSGQEPVRPRHARLLGRRRLGSGGGSRLRRAGAGERAAGPAPVEIFERRLQGRRLDRRPPARLSAADDRHRAHGGNVASDLRRHDVRHERAEARL